MPENPEVLRLTAMYCRMAGYDDYGLPAEAEAEAEVSRIVHDYSSLASFEAM